MDLQSKLIAYEQLICTSEDVNAKADSYEQALSVLKVEKAKLESQLSAAGTELEEATEKSYIMEKRADSHTQQLRARDSQIEAMRGMIRDLTVRVQGYTPAKVGPRDDTK